MRSRFPIVIISASLCIIGGSIIVLSRKPVPIPVQSSSAPAPAAVGLPGARSEFITSEPPIVDAPGIPAESQPISAVGTANRGVLERFLSNELSVRLTAAQVADYLRNRPRDAEGLMTAFRFTKDLELLREAAQLSPGNPQVQLQLALHSDNPAEQRRALEALKQNDPENGLADYLSALEHFRAGNVEEAMSDISVGVGKGTIDDYTRSASQSAEEAYMAAGFSVGEAKAAAIMSMERPHLTQLRAVASELGELQSSYAKNGEATTAATIAKLGVTLAQQMQRGAPCLIDELVANAMEKKFLATWEPADREARLAELQQRKGEITRMIGNKAPLQMGETEAIAYFDRQKLYGEFEALRWLNERHARSQ
jgi:hypothetical protein